MMKLKFLSLLLVLGIVSCSPTHSAILDDKTCNPPCWRDITIGQTTVDEAVTHVNQMTDIQKDTIKRENVMNSLYEDEEITWNFSKNVEFSGEILFKNSKAVMLFFPFQKQVKFEDVISRFGNPTSLIVESSKGPGIYLSAVFIYAKEGICLYNQPDILTQTQDLSSYSINQDTKHSPALPYLSESFRCLIGYTNKAKLNGFLRMLTK